MSVEGNNTPSSRPRLLWLCSHKLSTVTMFYYVFSLPAWLLGTELWCWKSMCQGVSVEGNKTPSFKPLLLWLRSHKLSTVTMFYYVFSLPAWLLGTELWCWKSMCQGVSVEGNKTPSFKPRLLGYVLTSFNSSTVFFCQHGSMGLSCDAGNPHVRARE